MSGLPRTYLMADHDASSLWTDEPANAMVPLEQLPLSEQTKADLEAWSAQLSSVEDAVWAEDTPEHQAEGRRLWTLVRDELAGVYEVGYAVFDHPATADPEVGRKRILWDPAPA